MLLHEIPFIWQYIKKKDYLPTFWTKIWHFGSLCTVLAHRLRARISAPRGNLYLKLQEHCLLACNKRACPTTLRLYGCYFFWLLRTILKEKAKVTFLPQWGQIPYQIIKSHSNILSLYLFMYFTRPRIYLICMTNWGTKWTVAISSNE